MRGIYVHIPFCRKRCLYCDFFTVGERLADWEGYVSALLREARFRLSDSGAESTLYIGGGTPSLIPEAEFKRLTQGLKELIPKIKEFTIEINPDDVTLEKAHLWKSCGVNRISMGVQSLVDDELKAIGRRHDASIALKAYETIRPLFPNISLDIIFGLPLQTVETLKTSVEGLIKLNPEHVSAYSLMYEERSALTKMLRKGMIKEMPEEDSSEMFRFLNSSLEEAGYEQYEISNYCRPGFRSSHNSLYWDGSPYVGLGAGAHGYDGNSRRFHNVDDIKKYMAFWNERSEAELESSIQDVTETEELSVADLREEMIMTRLRTREGIRLDEFEGRFGKSSLKKLLNDARRFIRAGNLENNNGCFSLTKAGIYISDHIFSSLF